MKNRAVTPLFLATEEAIINSLFAAKTMTGRQNHKRESIPIDKVIKVMKKYNGINSDKK